MYGIELPQGIAHRSWEYHCESVIQRPRLSIDIHPDLGKNPARDEASTLGPRSDNRARWLKFADGALHHHGATEEDIAELTNLTLDEQKTIKSRIQRTAHV